jgi:hypothetical protein
MKKIIGVVTVLALNYCGLTQEIHFGMTRELPKALKEVSGLARDGNALWTISDDNRSDIYKLDLQGNILQQVHLKNIAVVDVEAVAVDREYLYIGDVGDNDGRREGRQIIRIAKSTLGGGSRVDVNGELIAFVFPDEGAVKKKKSNNFDCEAVISYGDSLYLFTKRREDLKTELYVLPKSPGKYVARSLGVFKAKGLITDAAVNPEGNELALVGYDEGHTRPFIWIFDHFGKEGFFTGHARRFELTNKKKLDWQVESISYRDDNSFYIACERTKDVPNTIYIVDKKELTALKADGR